MVGLSCVLRHVDCFNFRNHSLLKWLKNIFQIHSAYLMECPSSEELLSPYLSLLRSREVLYPQMCQLKGKLELIKGNIQAKEFKAEQPNDALLVYQDGMRIIRYELLNPLTKISFIIILLLFIMGHIESSDDDKEDDNFIPSESDGFLETDDDLGVDEDDDDDEASASEDDTDMDDQDGGDSESSDDEKTKKAKKPQKVIANHNNHNDHEESDDMMEEDD